MTILGMFINNSIRTGANRRYLEMMEGLAARGHRVFVIMNQTLAYCPVSFTRIDFHVAYRRGKFPPASLLLYMAVKRNLEEIVMVTGDIDWIHIHSDMHLASAIYIKQRTDARLFFAVRCDDITRSRILREHLPYSIIKKISALCYEKIKKRYRENQLARFADKIVFQNSNDRDCFIARNNVSCANLKIIPGNIGKPRFLDEWRAVNKSTSVSTLVYCGTLSYSKGFHYVLQMLKKLKDKGYESIKLIVLGRIVQDDEMILLAQAMDVQSMIEFVGYVNPFEYFAKVDLYIYPSLYDSWPDVLLESLYAGCPVIGSKTGGIPELLEYPQLLFPPGDVVVMTAMVERMIQDTEYYQKIRSLCTNRVAPFEFDWIEKYEGVMCER